MIRTKQSSVLEVLECDWLIRKGINSLNGEQTVQIKNKKEQKTGRHRTQLAHHILVSLNFFLMQQRALLLKSAACWDYRLPHFAPSAISGDSEPNEASFRT